LKIKGGPFPSEKEDGEKRESPLKKVSSADRYGPIAHLYRQLKEMK